MASAGRARGAPRLCGDVGLRGRSLGRRKGAPDGGPARRGLPTRSSPSSSSNSGRPPRRGRFCRVEFCGRVFTQPGFPAPGQGPIPHRVTRSLPPASAVATRCFCPRSATGSHRNRGCRPTPSGGPRNHLTEIGGADPLRREGPSKSSSPSRGVPTPSSGRDRDRSVPTPLSEGA